MANVPFLNNTTLATPSSVNLSNESAKWDAKVYVEAERQMFWTKFEGPEGSMMPVIRKDNSGLEAGQLLYIQTYKQLTGAGVTGESTLRGNEEKLSAAQTSLQVEWLRHSTSVTKRSMRALNVDVVREVSQPMLSMWLAEKMDTAIFDLFDAATVSFFGGDATSTGTIDASDTMNTSLIRKIALHLRDNLAKPLRTNDGREFYGMVISPRDAYYLKGDSVWQQAQRDANLRGDMNPIFTGALGVYDGVILYENKGCPVSGNVGKSIAFGGEALFRGYAALPQFAEQVEDYGFEYGVAVQGIYGQALNDAVNTNFVVAAAYVGQPS